MSKEKNPVRPVVTETSQLVTKAGGAPGLWIVIPIVIALYFLLTCCHPKIITNTKTVVKDSVIYKITEKRDTVKIKGETVTVHHSIPCPDLKPFSETQKSGRSSVTLKGDSAGNLTATSNCDSLFEVIKRMDTTTQHFHSSVETIHDTKIVSEIKWYHTAAVWAWLGIFALLGIGALLKFVFKVW